MTLSSLKSFPLLVVLTTLFVISLKPCSCHNKTHWNTAGITWYGEREGPGSTGGACGYCDAVAKHPVNGMVSAGGPSLYRDGKGCGSCYRLKCDHPLCTKKPIKVMIADECAGCTKQAVHFDLSGKAFGKLAKHGKGDQLRNLGELNVQYKRACCKHKRSKIAIHVDPGANPYYMSFTVKYANGDGNFACVEIQPAGEKYIKMEGMRSAVWKLNPGRPLKGPFHIRLTSAVTHKVIIAKSVIPEKWNPGHVYSSHVNFAIPMKHKSVHKKHHRK